MRGDVNEGEKQGQEKNDDDAWRREGKVNGAGNGVERDRDKKRMILTSGKGMRR